MGATNAKAMHAFGRRPYSHMCWVLTCTNNVIAGRSTATLLWRRTFQLENLIFMLLYIDSCRFD